MFLIIRETSFYYPASREGDIFGYLGTSSNKYSITYKNGLMKKVSIRSELSFSFMRVQEQNQPNKPAYPWFRRSYFFIPLKGLCSLMPQ